MKELIAKHFDVLRGIHELSIAFMFGPSAPYLGVIPGYINRTFGKDFRDLTNKEFGKYLTDYGFETSFHAEIMAYTKVAEEKRKDYAVNKIGRDNILSLAKDIDVASPDLEILEGLNEAIIEFRQKLLEVSLCRQRGEGNAIGDFFTNLSAGLGLRYATLNLPVVQKTIISYHLIRNSGVHYGYSDPLLLKITNESQLEDVRLRIEEWDKASLAQYEPTTAEIVHHFWRNGYLRYKNDRLDRLQFYQGVLVDHIYRPVMESNKPEFVV